MLEQLSWSSLHQRRETAPQVSAWCWNNWAGHLSTSAGKQHESPCCTKSTATWRRHPAWVQIWNLYHHDNDADVTNSSLWSHAELSIASKLAFLPRTIRDWNAPPPPPPLPLRKQYRGQHSWHFCGKGLPLPVKDYSTTLFLSLLQMPTILQWQNNPHADCGYYGRRKDYKWTLAVLASSMSVAVTRALVKDTAALTERRRSSSSSSS